MHEYGQRSFCCNPDSEGISTSVANVTLEEYSVVCGCAQPVATHPWEGGVNVAVWHLRIETPPRVASWGVVIVARVCTRQAFYAIFPCTARPETRVLFFRAGRTFFQKHSSFRIVSVQNAFFASPARFERKKPFEPEKTF